MNREEKAIRKLNYTLIMLIFLFCVMVIINANSGITSLTGYVTIPKLFTKSFIIMQGISLAIIILVIALMLIRKRPTSTYEQGVIQESISKVTSKKRSKDRVEGKH